MRRELAYAFGLCCLLRAGALTPAKAQSDGAGSSCADLRGQLEEAQQYVHRNNFPRAIQVLRLAFDACPRSSAAGVELTKAYVAAREFREAERTAKKVLEIDADSEAAQFLLAYSYFMQERFAETGNLLRPFLARHPENAGAHKLMGLTLFFYKEYVAAERELSIAHQKDPKNADMKMALVPKGPKDRTTFAWTAITAVSARTKNPEIATKAMVALPPNTR